MKRSFWNVMGFGLLVAFAMSAVACGGPPSLEEIESNLDKPNETISGPMIAKGYQSYDHGALAVNMPTMGNYGKMISFLKADTNRTSNVVPMKTYLRQSGLPANVVEQIMPLLPVNNDMTIKKKYVQKGEFGVVQQAQTFGKCVSGGLTGLDGSFSITVELDCLGQGSGRVVMNATPLYSVFELKKGVAFRLDIRFQNACDSKGNCVDGGMLYKVGVVTGDDNTGIRLMLSMALKVTTADGAEAKIKQGIRVSALAGDSSGLKIEVLTYLKDEEEREHTMVLVLSSADKFGTFSVRGANGRFVCSSPDRGKTGSCHAEGKEGVVAFKW